MAKKKPNPLLAALEAQIEEKYMKMFRMNCKNPLYRIARFGYNKLNYVLKEHRKWNS